MTRYEVYRYEIDAELAAQNTGIPQTYPNPANNVSMLEDGKTCNYDGGGDPNNPVWPYYSDPSLPGATGSALIDRRLIYLAIVICVEHEPLHGASSNNPDGIPIIAVGEIFLTEPSPIPGGGNPGVVNDKHAVWGEIADILESDSLVQHDIVQLYR